MKYLTLILLTMLIGCQTVDTLPLDTSSTKSVITTQQKVDKKIPVPSPPPNNTGTIQVSKSIICGPMAEVLEDLVKRYQEKPFALWQDQAHGHPVVLLLNKQTRTSTVLEYPGTSKNSIYYNKACIISAGVNTVTATQPSTKTNVQLYKK